MLLTCTLLGLTALAQHFPDSEKDGKYYTVNGAKIWTVSFGKGDPLFIIPGGPGSAHSGLRDFDSLATHCALVYFDGFGRGKSDQAKDVKEYSIDRDVEDIEGIRKALGYEKINVLGHSYGGVVAQLYAVKYGNHLKHLIIANSFYSGGMWQENDDNSNSEISENYPEVWERLMKVRNAGSISSDSDHIAIYGEVPYGFLYAYNPGNFLKGLDPKYPNPFNGALYYQLVGADGDFIIGSDMYNFDVRKQLKDLKMPVLIVAGRFDRVSVPKCAVRYKEYCPQAQFVMFEKSGHNPQVEEPEKEFKIIREFLSK